MDLRSFAAFYLDEFCTLSSKLESFKKNAPISFEQAIEEVTLLVQDISTAGKKIMMIGNGGSAAIASHQAVDYWKNGGVRAMAFNDSSLLTCISNDCGYENVFAKPIEQFADPGDMVIAISSSGNSENIINGVQQAIKSKCKVITLSGFDLDNKLRSLGDIAFYVPSCSYGFVEIMHLLIVHCILDAKMYCLDGIDVFNKNAKR